MADAQTLLKAGDPVGALDALKAEVRRAPREARLRVFLFQLFCVFGEWDRALTQLGVAAELDPLAIPMAEAYRTLIRCEMVRERVWAGSSTPTVFGQPQPWMPLLVEANRLLATGAAAAAAALRDRAFEQIPAVPGQADGVAFEWLADADPRLGPVFEAVVDGTYYWIPMEHVARLAIEPPADLRDQVWLPVRFTWNNGGEAVGFMPSRYPGSAAADPALATGRRTEWRDAGGDGGTWEVPIGQRMFATEAGELPLLDLRELAFEGGTPDGGTPDGRSGS